MILERQKIISQVKSLRFFIIQATVLVRWQDWAASKLPFIAIGYFLLLLTQSTGAPTISIVIRVLIFSSCYLAFGYLYNDWTDRYEDRQVGKTNLIGSWQPFWVISTLIGLVGMSLLSLGSLLSQLGISLLVVLCYVLALAYSAPIIHLKERGVLGLFSAALAQRTLPASLLFVAAHNTPFVLSIFYLSLTLVVGLRWMITHQLADHDNDHITGTRTFVTQTGYDAAQHWLTRMILIEIALGVVLIYLVASQHQFILVIPIIYTATTILLTWTTGESLRQMLLSPNSAFLVLSDWYFIYWPVGLALLCTNLTPSAVLFAGALVGLQWGYICEHLHDLHKNLIKKMHQNEIP